MSKRRGKRVVVGYVVSLSGKRGGPWEATFGRLGTPTYFPHTMLRYADADDANLDAKEVRAKHPHARALPLVRYELDAEEERLRDAVVEAADAMEAGRGDSILYNDGIYKTHCAVRALRAHREKVGK